MDASFKKRLTLGEPLIGTILTLASQEIAEVYSRCGFDWLFIDMEHSALSIREAQTLLLAAGGTPCLVRVPCIDEAWIKKALDIGAAGVIIPQVNSAEQARQAVRLCKYPPQGVRGAGVWRAQEYGDSLREYIAAANTDTVVIVQIEHIDGVKNLPEILQVAGIDGLFVGPLDLSASLGKAGQMDDPELREAIRQVQETAARSAMPLGIYCPGIEAARAHMQGGYTLLAVGIDINLVGQAAKDIVAGLGKR